MSEACSSYDFSDFFKYFMDKSRLLFAERSQKVALYVLQGKTGILACKRYGSTALSYEQVRDDTVDKMLCLRVYFIKYVITTHLAVFKLHNFYKDNLLVRLLYNDEIFGKVQNMDPWSSVPGPSKYGPGRWTAYFYYLSIYCRVAI